MTTKRTVALGLLALSFAACGSNPIIGSRFSGPASIAVFNGLTRKDAANLRSYVAVASSRGDELRFIDPSDLQPVVGPAAVFPLSVPTAPNPLLLASASLGDGQADVLVAVSAGGTGFFPGATGPALQVIETWDATNRVAYDVKLGAADLTGGLAAGSEILCLAGTPARSGTSARILVGATGGQLAVVEFTRATDGSSGVVAGTPVVKTVGFDPADIAGEPGGTHLFIATRDPITATAGGSPVNGVAMVDASGAATAAWSVTALGALAPTVAVAAAAGVFDRTVNSGDQNSADEIVVAAPLRVYAALDPDFCGPDKPINCGIVAVEPGAAAGANRGNLAADPAACSDPAACTAITQDSAPAGAHAAAQPYRAPMPVPGVPTHIAIGYPPAGGSQRITNDARSPNVPLLTIAPGTGQRNTSAVAMVTSSDGSVYWFDLSRWGPPSDVSVMKGSTRVAVTGASQVSVSGGTYQVGLWIDAAPFGSTDFVPSVTTSSAGLVSAIDVWPGFTDADVWNVTYQGALPFLGSQPAILAASGSNVYAALQSDNGSGLPVTSSGRWTVSQTISDPALGVRAGDIVQLPDCETKVVAVIPPDLSGTTVGVAAAGGALQLDASVSCVPVPAAGQPLSTTVTVLAAGLVLSNEKLGYLGRPDFGRTASFDNTFAVAWSDESALAPSSEALALARKARRLFYPSDGPCPIPGAQAGTESALTAGCYGTGLKRLSDPLAPGPIIRFRVGLVGPNPADATSFPPRGAGILFNTQAGLSRTLRKPISGGGGAQPGGVVTFDRTAPGTAQFAGHENDPVDFFVPYLDDQVVFFSPTQSSSDVVSIR